jgi:multidrug efflux pump subunit AcrB
MVAVLVVPPLALRLMSGRQSQPNVLERLASAFGKWVDRLAEIYVGLLRRALRQRLVAMLVVLACFVATMRVVGPIIGQELMPPMDTGIMIIAFELPPSATIERMEATLNDVEAILRQEPSVRTISSVIGSEPGEVSFGTGGQTAQQASLTVNLVTRDLRDRTIWQIADEWRERISRIHGLRSLQVYEFGASPMSTSRAPVDLLLSGEDPRVLASLSGEVLQRLDGQPGLLDCTPSWWMDKQEVNVRVDPRVARLHDTSPGAVAEQLRLAVGGVVASALRLRGFLDVPIRVAYEDQSVATPERLSELDIYTPKGPVPLRGLASIEPALGQTVITREDLRNTIDITGYNRTLRIVHVLDGIGRRLRDFQLPGGYTLAYSGTAAEMADSMPRVMNAIFLGLLLLLVLLMGVFRSFLLPLPILVAIPLAIMGSLWGLLLLQKPMCMPAMMGIVLLAGIVINNSIFLIDFIQQASSQGMPRDEAMEQAVRLRLRPVLMTTISTFVGMLPMILETAIGLERMSPLATAAGFGLLVGTVMTLVITPVTYTLLDDAAKLWDSKSA